MPKLLSRIGAAFMAVDKWLLSRSSHNREWTPGRVIDLFDGWEPPDGCAWQAAYLPINQHVAFSLVDEKSKEIGVCTFCVCPICLVAIDYPTIVDERLTDLAESFRPITFSTSRRPVPSPN